MNKRKRLLALSLALQMLLFSGCGKSVNNSNEGYSEKEISEILNIPIKSVYNAVYRSHKKSSLTKEIKCDKL